MTATTRGEFNGSMALCEPWNELKAIAGTEEKGQNLISQKRRIEYARLGISASNMKRQRRLKGKAEVEEERGRERRIRGRERLLVEKVFSRRLASQSPSLDWCFHSSGVHTITMIRNASLVGRRLAARRRKTPPVVVGRAEGCFR